MAAALAERGIRATSIRGRTWRDLYIRKLSPAEAADRAAADYKRRGRWSIAPDDGVRRKR